MKRSGYQRRNSYRLLLLILWLALLVFVVELTVGWITRSLCLLAEALHTLVDIFSVLLSLVAVTSHHRTLGKEIWGHGRGEVAGALVLSAILGFASISIFLVAFEQVSVFFQTRQGLFPVTLTPPLIVLILVSVVLMVSAVWVAARQSRQNNSLALQLSTQHILGSAWLSGFLLLGLIAIGQGYRWLDPAVAAIWVVLASRSLWQVLQRQLPMLLTPTAIAPEAISQVVCQTEGVTRCTRILSRGMVGRQVWIELHIMLHPEYMVIANTIGEKVERRLREQYGPVRSQIWLDQNPHASAPIGPR